MMNQQGSTNVLDIHPGLRRRLAARRIEPTVNNIDIAERLHAAALFNHARILSSPTPDTVKLLSWPEMTEEQQHLYTVLARAAVLSKGRV